jgi:hypothetical protein
MKKFQFYNCNPILCSVLMLLGASTKAQTLPKPVFTKVSKGDFPNYIVLEWQFDMVRYPNVHFEVARKPSASTTQGNFNVWKPIRTECLSLATNDINVEKGLGLRYTYRVKAIYNNVSSEWSKEDVGYLNDYKPGTKTATILQQSEKPYHLAWSPVQGATGYRLQIVAAVSGTLPNLNLETGFALPILKDTILTENQYIWTGGKPIHWSVQCLYETEQSDFAAPLSVVGEAYGGARVPSKRDTLIKLVDCNPKRFCFLVQNPTKDTLKDIRVGLYLSNNPTFNGKQAILVKNTRIALPPKQQKGFSETLKTKGYKYLHVVPVKSGRILMDEIETIPIF